jgi:protein ImuB
LWLAVHLPALMLDSLREAVQALAAATPVAVVDLERNGKVVRACSAGVYEAGVRNGMSVNAALALVPTLQTLARDPRRERHLLEVMAQRGLHFTPRVSLEPPDGVLLEVRGSLRLFGGARRLCELLQADLTATTGATVRFAITPAPLAALWFARQAETSRTVLVRRHEALPGRLSALPLTCTRWPERSQQMLGTMGVRTIGECLRLPRDGFARRFGAALLTTLDRATGRLPEPRAGFAAREKFSTRRDLEPEVAATERLGRALEPLLEELCRFLRERGRAMQTLELQLHHREVASTHVRMRFMQPMGAQPQRIAELLREKLARVALPQPVRAVRLVSGPLVEMTAVPIQLFADDRRESSVNMPQLVERLRARLGVTAVHGLACVPEHRPEAAWRATEPVLQGSVGPDGKRRRQASSPEVREAGATMRQAGLAGLRPLWLLDEPQFCPGRLELEDGPACIQSGWRDGQDIARDYYVARNGRGMRLWVFRNRRDAEARGWFIHGYFG